MPSSLKLLRRLFSELEPTPRLSNDVLQQLSDHVNAWGQHLTKMIKATDATGEASQSKQHAVLGIQFWSQMIHALGNHIVTAQRELTNNICVVMGAGFKSTRREIVVETLVAWKALISAFATEKQWSAVGTKGKSKLIITALQQEVLELIAFIVYGADRRLDLILKALRHRMSDEVADEVFDVWWYLAKTLGVKLPQVFDEVRD